MPSDGFAPDTNLADVGFESVTLGSLAEALNAKFGIDIGTDVFFGYPTFLRLSQFLSGTYEGPIRAYYQGGKAEEEAASQAAAADEDSREAEAIAIIGMSGQFPDARNVNELWEILINGREAAAAIPESRFPVKTGPAARMGMLLNPDLFDPLFFDIAPSEAEEIDPRHRLLLEESWKALEDAGLGGKDLEGARIGVFVGAEDSDRQIDENDQTKITSWHEGVMASRLAYQLNFSGPCMSVNTACSSGLTAFHQACLSIRNGDCDMALAAGVNLTSEAIYRAMGRAGMLSKDGRCRAFDQQATGMIPADAVAVVVLKKLSQARKDHHRIYGVVAGTGINYDGKTSGITSPSIAAQEDLYRRVYDRRGIDPGRLSLVVTHGTGTKIGDPIEINALVNAFAGKGMQPDQCALISLKPNLGHALAASGVVSLIGLLKAMQEEMIPGSINVTEPNKLFRLRGSPFYLNLHNRPWTEKEQGPRLAAVSAFGMSGTNVHVAIQSVPPAPRGEECPAYLMVFSAKTPAALMERLRDMGSWLRSQERPDLTSVSYTLMEGRYHFRFRKAFVVRDREEFISALEGTAQDSLREVDREFYERPSERRAIDEMQAEAGRTGNASLLARLGEKYCQGYGLDGNLLLEKHRPCRISLPEYPFENSPYWWKERASDAILTPEWVPAETGKGPALLPGLILCADETKADRFRAAFPHASVVTDFTLSAQPADCRHIVIAGFPGGGDPCGTEAILAAFRASRALLGAFGSDRKMDVTVFTHMGQAVRSQDIVSPQQAGIAGFFGVLAKEAPKWKIRVLDTEPGIENESLLQTLPETESGQIAALRGNTWFIRRMTKKKLYTQKPFALRREGVYVVLGGTGDVGSLWTEYAVRMSGAQVIWAGRREETDAIRQKMDFIGSFGPRPVYMQADVLDAESLIRLRDRTEKEFGPIRGVILSTVAEFDRGIRTMEEDEFRRIVTLKALGCLNAESVFGDSSLDFMLNFSSSSAVDMPMGQAGYTAGCCFQDAYAHRISVEGSHPYRTVNWGFWGKVGAGKTMPDSILARIEQTGMRALEPEKAFVALERFLRSGQVQMEYVNMVSGQRETVTEVPAADAEEKAAARARGSMADYVVETLCRVLKLRADQIDVRERFEKYGIDSITVLQLIDAFRERIPDLESTVFYEFRTAQELIGHMEACYALEPGAPAKTEAAVAPVTETRENAEETDGIAVIGMSGRFAGAGNLAEYWSNLANGVDSVGEIPASRWSLEGFYEPDMEKAIREKKSYCKSGGFLDDITSFDARFFHISPREAANLDPQERLLLEESYKALENAAYPPGRIQAEGRNDMGVFVGVTRTGFELYNPQLWEQGDPRILTTNFAEMANRISYSFDLKGPSMAIDTMCSSSLTALHEACENLRRGACRMALVGTANIYTHPATYRLFCEKRMLSPTGKCHTFSKDADGFVPGEGVAALVLKPLSQAIRDHDQILGVIRATSANHDGRTNGFTVPSPAAQAELIRAALDRARISAREISCVEAHGTGTKLGDPIEIGGLTKAYRADTADNGYCAIGSAKSNIGHCEAAAGLAGVIKVLLQMRYRTLAPSLHAEELNPLIQFEQSPFRVQRAKEFWARPVLETDGKRVEISRKAAVSAFGAGGSNAHVILEESPYNL